MSTDPSDVPPDWTAVELACPLCGYDLRGLATPRCPECGFAFTWGELLDAKRDRHPWLFEHAHQRRARSFLATYARTALPRRFWREVTPANPVAVGRLVLYWALASTVLAAAVVVPVVRTVVQLAQADMTTRAAYTPTPGQPGSFTGPAPAASAFSGAWTFYTPASVRFTTMTTAQLDQIAPRVGTAAFWVQAWDAWQGTAGSFGLGRRRFGREDTFDVPAVVVVLAWPWLSAAALLLFQASMRQAKVRPAHVLRVAVYGCECGLLVLAVEGVLYGTTIGYMPLAALVPVRPFSREAQPALAAVGLCLAVAGWRLSIAYRRYLRFDRPALTVLAAQLIVVLLVLVVLSRTIRIF